MLYAWLSKYSLGVPQAQKVQGFSHKSQVPTNIPMRIMSLRSLRMMDDYNDKCVQHKDTNILNDRKRHHGNKFMAQFLCIVWK